VNTIENWGNYLIIQSHLGHFVELSHFAYASLKVRKGDLVEAGQILGLCGNSGYSPQPHIHIQVQESAVLGSKTLPFRFVSYIQGDQVQFYENPPENTEIDASFSDRALDGRLSFTLDTRTTYDVYQDDELIDTLRLTVKMDRISGAFYFDDGKGDTLHFAKEAGMFYLYDYEGRDGSWLQRFYIAIARIPLSYRKGLSWEDYLPMSYVDMSSLTRFFSIGAMLFPQRYITKGVWHFKDEEHIEGLLSGEQPVRVELDLLNGFRRIEVETYTLERRDDDQDHDERPVSHSDASGAK